VDLVQSHVADYLQHQDEQVDPDPGTVSRSTLLQLKKRGYLTRKSPPEERAYVVELGKRAHRVATKHAAPGVLMIPTYDCNLRCAYCYEHTLQSREQAWLETRMTPERVEAAFDAIRKIGGETRHARALTLYGGEPFQRKQQEIVHLIHEKARKQGFQRFSAITNAVELDAFVDLLGPKHRFSFLQITLDGPPQVHDQRRFLPDRTGTFRLISDNIELALKHEVEVSVRINVDRGNARHVPELREFFLKRGWSRSALFRAYCSPVHGGACGKASRRHYVNHLDMQHAVESNFEGSGLAPEETSFQVASFTNAIKKRLSAHLGQKRDLPHWRTAFCGSNLSMYLFDPFGDIYPCWEVIGHPKHRIGTYGPGFLELDPRSMGQWHARSVVEILACRSCAYLFFCGGGCEAFAYQATGHLDHPHCFDFPKHFRQAAQLAYNEWREGRTTEGAACA